LHWLDPLRRRQALSYKAGPAVDDAIDVCRRLRDGGIASAVSYTTERGQTAREIVDAYLEAFDRLAHDGLDVYVSIKLSGLRFDPALLAELQEAATSSGLRLHVDALTPETADRTLQLLEAAPDPRILGATLPGRWQRSIDDSSRLTAMGLSLRVVKGHWNDNVHGSSEPGRGFLNVIDRLQGYQGKVGVATHDIRLLEASLRLLQTSATPCEAELLYGLPFRGPAKVARSLGVPIRVYVPYGHTGAPYGIGHVLTHPAASWWLLQDLVLGKDKEWRSIRRSIPRE
jgi:proline dehydrogenase